MEPAMENTHTKDSVALPGIEVPVLCYHQIREWKGNESRLAKDVIVPPARFKAQMQILADSGYQTVLPDQLYDYLTKGTPLPPKPIMITFDDGVVDQYTIGAPELKKHGFKGVFFIMTISLGRSIYMSKEQVKGLAEEGHAIETHTWSHQNLKKYQPEDWDEQIVKSCKQLEDITGKPVRYLAYPFGVWTQEGIPELKKRDIKAAFQLSTKIDENEPLYTIRRMIVPGDWNPESMIRAMNKTFKTRPGL
ncbi:MAG: polysaccharide deacetylase family protein [Chitinophagaceae bacterium]|nr:polysaccharide deacetylase family protein [Chitinophagaceae bacterium]MCW5927761.1 polysaccharide deacetylase family protein [Chitinophagaceae bacterium]